jgi:hypothetical protein
LTIKKIYFMKKLLSIFSIAAIMTACTSNADKVAAENARLQSFRDSVRLAADTAGLAEYQAWKSQREIDVNEDLNTENTVASAAAPAAAASRNYSSTRRASTSTARRSTGSRSSGGGGTMTSTSSNTAQQKKGWSKAAKGAVIGGAGGAVAGAVINKRNRGVGAVVGGVIGAGGGYIFGRSKDKKDGRY